MIYQPDDGGVDRSRPPRPRTPVPVMAGRCEKCGYDDVTIRYVEPRKGERDPEFPSGEWHVVTCRICGYHWRIPCLSGR